MSYFKSIEQAWIKIQQKNIVVIDGNVDEIISKNFEWTKKFLKQNDSSTNFIDLTELISNRFLSTYNNGQINYFSTITGNNILSNNKEIVDYKDKSENDEFSFDSSSNENAPESIDEFINNLKNKIKIIKNNNSNSEHHLFIVNFGDMFFNANNSNLVMHKLAELVESFVEIKNVMPKKLRNDLYKFVIIARNAKIINSLITNNVEFASIFLPKPNKDERELFFKIYSNQFKNLKETINQIDHIDFYDAIKTSNGMSFREIFQLSKIENNDNEEVTFSELYKLSAFSKKDSEWEKINDKQLNNIKDILSNRVKGQDKAIEKVKSTLIRSFIGMNGILHSFDNNKPKGALFFAGPTGVGKTELAKTIAEFVFGDENRIIRFDMSEFNHEHSDQRLIGAPPGYVGYDKGGELTEAVKANPFSILLFDEIEKANGKILDKFLQILEDGRLTSSQGEIIDFSQTFIIFTSNIGASNANNLSNYQEISNHFLNEVKMYFKQELNRPEILNRIGEKNIIAFDFINDPKIIQQIVASKLKKLKNNLFKYKNIDIEYNEIFIDSINSYLYKNFKKEYGGRGLITELETLLIDKLSNYIFENYSNWQKLKFENNVFKIKLNFENDQIIFN